MNIASVRVGAGEGGGHEARAGSDGSLGGDGREWNSLQNV
jgi:hypothetical protein